MPSLTINRGESVGQAILRVRKRLGVSQLQLGIAANVSQQTVAKAEKGRSDIPARTVTVVADAMAAVETVAAMLNAEPELFSLSRPLLAEILAARRSDMSRETLDRIVTALLPVDAAAAAR